jgi:hypothetical protein
VLVIADDRAATNRSETLCHDTDPELGFQRGAAVKRRVRSPMPASTSTPHRVSAGLASVFLLASCASDDPSPRRSSPNASGGTGGASIAGSTSSGGSAATAGAMSTGGTGGATSGGATATGGMTTGGATASGGAPTGGSTATGGATSGGATSGGAAGASSGGAMATGGATSGGTGADAGASGASGAQGGNAQGGGNPTGGSTAGGMAGAGGSATVDQNGVPLAKPGDSKNGSREYLNLGDMRLIANKWGSDELNCNTSLSVFVNADKTFGWDFDRGACGGDKAKPDYPEIEFGIHPFGAGNSLATTPSFSSTSVLPIQIKDITSASVTLDSLNISIQRATTYNLNFEFWLSQRNPVTDANPGVHAELITFFGWQDGWACDKSGNVQAGDKGFSLCHQDDAWAGGKWRYFQFRLNGGSTNSVSGKLDVKALIDWLVSNAGYSRDLWVTRLEVGSEIDDNTAGRVTLKNITFEVNGTSKSAQFGQ